jgi:hypothetical protein
MPQEIEEIVQGAVAQFLNGCLVAAAPWPTIAPPRTIS